MSTPRELVALQHQDELRSPRPGWFHRIVAPDHSIAPGDVLGELEVLGQVTRIVAPKVRGIAVVPDAIREARRAVGYASLLVIVAPMSDTAREPIDVEASARPTEAGLVFRSPSSGRYYGRPTPDKPAFVTAGNELAAGDTVCLLEVMKTFHRVTYGGPDVPPRARVKAVLVADGADVSSGDPLLSLEAS